MKTLILAAIIILTPAKAKEPQLKNLGNGNYVLVNPLPRTIHAEVSCGRDWEPIYIIVKADGYWAFRIMEPNEVPSEAFCFLDKY